MTRSHEEHERQRGKGSACGSVARRHSAAARPKIRRASAGGTGHAGRQGHAGDLRLRTGRRDRRLQTERPRLVRRQPAVAAAERRRPVRPGRPFLSERASEPPRRQGRDSDGRRPREGPVRVRHVRRGRRRRPDDDPFAPRVGTVEADRRRPDQQPVHGRGRLPERRSTTGGRTACCSSGTCRCSGSRTTRATRTCGSRSRTPGASGDAGVLARPRRAAEREGTVSVARFHRSLSSGQEVGLRPGRRRAPLHRVRRPPAQRPVRSERPRLGLGHQRQLEREGRAERRAAPPGRSRAPASRTTSTTRRWTSRSRATSATR